jgi:hypothetical protein
MEGKRDLGECCRHMDPKEYGADWVDLTAASEGMRVAMKLTDAVALLVAMTEEMLLLLRAGAGQTCERQCS